MRTPDQSEFARLQAAAGDRIRILTLAPELPNALNLIAALARAEVLIGLSHTDGTPEDIRAAIRAGATLSTHLGNGCPEMIHRHRAPLWTQLAQDELFASIICDRFHLPSDVVKVIYRMKGPDNCILVTDAIHLCGMPAGKYKLVTTEVELSEDGKVFREGGGSLAGSTLTMDRAVGNFMELADVSLSQALKAAVANPARFLGVEAVPSAVTTGSIANLITYRCSERKFRVESCVVHGEQVFP